MSTLNFTKRNFRGRTINVSAPAGVGDPNWNNVVFASYGNSVSVDLTGKAITAVGNTCSSSAVVKHGAYAWYFDGAGDYLELASSTEVMLAASDFTIEAYVYILSFALQNMLFYWNGNSSGYALALDVRQTTGKVGVYASASGSSWWFYGETDLSLTAGVWSHVAFIRKGTNFYISVDGEMKLISGGLGATALYTGLINRIGVYNAGIAPINGYLDDVRITKVARYTANFTPPAQFDNYQAI